MKKGLIVLGILITALAISAWGFRDPAAVYCGQLGYQYTTKQIAEGDVGYCEFSDGTECQEFDFLQGVCGMQHSYCAQKGYQQKAATGTDCGSSDPTTACLLCIMPNGTAEEVSVAMDLGSLLNDLTTLPVAATSSTVTSETVQTTQAEATTEETPTTTSPEPTTTSEPATTEPGTTTTTTTPAASPAPFDPITYLPYALVLIVLVIVAYIFHKKADDARIKKEREDFLKWKREQEKK